MPQPFFTGGPATDQHYVNVRDGVDELVVKARAFVESIWLQCALYLDPGVPARARASFASAFWEMYLTHTLLENGILLVPRTHRQPALKGPDLLAMQPKVWIEAVAPGPGETADGVPDPPTGEVYRVPDEQVMLRFRSAIEEKLARHTAYVEHGWLAPTEPFVIAISGSRMRFFQFTEMPLRRIVRCVLPFGFPQITIDRASMQVVDRGYSYRAEIQKQGGSIVAKDLFLQDAYASISALLYAPSDEVNRPANAGCEFILVRNPLAVAPLPPAWLPCGREYWVEGDHLCSEDHSAEG